MTVAVSCNLSDGVILGVDSAVTLPTPQGGPKIYENAEKLFQLGTRPIGVAVYGLGALGSRSIGTYLREFVVKDPAEIVTGQTKISDIVEQLRLFFVDAYRQTVIPAVEAALKESFDKIPPEKWPVLGLVVGGFSSDAYLSEVWQIVIPVNSSPGSATQVRGPGNFGSNWFALWGPIHRYVKGYDQALLNDILNLAATLRGSPWTPQEAGQFGQVIQRYEYGVLFDGMPIQEGLDYTRFLVDFVINHHRFCVGAEMVGGKARLGKVTYRGEGFQILDP